MSSRLLSAVVIAGALLPLCGVAAQADGADRELTAMVQPTSVEPAAVAPSLQPADPQVPPLPLRRAPEPVVRPPLRLASIGQGEASWYGPGLYGNRTANGEVLRPGTFTAAHRTLPFGTRVRVTNLANGRSTVVRINDRGPFHGGRVIDLAHGAASELGVVASGTAPVRLEQLR
ncbi:MAG: septal ring lytic transglycosylase RlpA family protein [Cyanobacteriota bacterium]